MGHKTLGVPSCLGLNYEILEIATSGGYDEPTLWEPKVGYSGPHLGKQTKDYTFFVPINPQYLCHKGTPGNEGPLPPALSNSAGISDWSKPAHHGD